MPTRTARDAGPRAGLLDNGVPAPLLVVAVAALWGTTGTAQALGAVDEPVVVGAARLAVGAGVLLLIALATGRGSALLGCLRPPLLGWTAPAALATAVFQTAFFSAVASTGVATGTIVALGTAPVATGLFGLVLFGERLTGRWAGATGLAVAGCVVLVTAGDADISSVRQGGIVLALLAGACYGLFTSAAKASLDRGVPIVSAMAVTLGLGAVLLAPVLLSGGSRLGGGRPLLMVAWLGLATTAAAYLLFARGLRRLPANTVGTLSQADPLTAAALGVLVLGARPGRDAAIGAAVLLAGLLAALGPIRKLPVCPPAEHSREGRNMNTPNTIGPGATKAAPLGLRADGGGTPWSGQTGGAA